MKKYIFTILAILLLVIGCDTQTVVTKGEISVNINGRSIDPISMETEYYKVSVSSGENLQSIPRVEKDTGTVRFSVDSGNWKVCVEAYNNHGDLIGRGEKEVSVSSGSVASCNVTVEEISGTGTFTFYYSCDYEDTSSNPWDRSIKAQLSPIDDSVPTTVIEGSVSNCSYKYNSVTVNNGYYVFELYVGEKLIYTEEVRIVADQVSSLYGNLTVASTSGNSSFSKNEQNIDKKFGEVKIVVDNTSFPADAQINAIVTGDVVEKTLDIKWYINDKEISWGKELSWNIRGFSAGDKLRLSVVVTVLSEGGYEYYEDYCNLTIVDSKGFPDYMDIVRNDDTDNKHSLSYSYEDTNFSVSCKDTKGDTSYKGDWYINDVLVQSDSDSLKLNDLTPYLGKNEIKFVYTIDDYSISEKEIFDVNPVVKSVTVTLDKPYAGRKNTIKLDIKTNPENVIKNNSLSVEFINESEEIIWNTEYLPVAGKYEVVFSDFGYFYRYHTNQFIEIIDATEGNDLMVLPGTTLTRGAKVDIRIPYDVGENVEEVKWFLDGELLVTNIFWGSGTPGSDDYVGPDFNDYTDNDTFLSFSPLDWPAGKHVLKAEVRTRDDVTTKEFVKEIEVVDPLTSFNINYKKSDNGKISFQALPSSSDFEEYETTLYVYGSEYKSTGEEWIELEIDQEYFDYIYHVTYKDDKGNTYYYDDYGNYYFGSKNDFIYISFDKYIYRPSDYVVFNLHAPLLKEGYIFKLDDEEIDIDYDGDGEYLLPRVEDLGEHTLSIWTTNGERPLSSRSFVVSAVGFRSETPEEVYQRLVIALPNNSETGSSQYSGVENGGSEETGKPGFGLEASYESLIIYENSYAVYGFAASQGPIIDGGEITKGEDGTYTLTSAMSQAAVTYKKNSDGNLCDNDGNVVYEKINGAESEGEGYLGSWEFAEIRPDVEVLNALLSEFVPDEGMPFDSLVEFGEGEGVGLNLQFAIDEDWITAYIDLDLDVTGLDRQISLAPGFKLHLSGKAEYDVYDEGCLSIIGNGLPIYIQPTTDVSVLLIHMMVHVGDGNFISIAVPLKRTEKVSNPVNVDGGYLSEERYITLDSLYSFISETTGLVNMTMPGPGGETIEIPGSMLISSMFASGPVEIAKVGENKKSFEIDPGKWSVSDVTMDKVKEIVKEIASSADLPEPTDEAIEELYGSMCLIESDNETDNEDINKVYNDFRNIFGNTLYVMMNGLEFLDDSSWLLCSIDEEDINENLVVFKALERLGGSQIVFTPMKQEGNTIYVQVEYHKSTQSVKKGFLKLTLEKASTDISFLYDYFSSYTELGLEVDSKDVYVEFGQDGNIWYKVGKQSYSIASYAIANDSIVIKTDATTILELFPSIEIPVSGWALEVGVVLPFDSESNKIVFFEGEGAEAQKAGIELVELNNQV